MRLGEHVKLINETVRLRESSPSGVVHAYGRRRLMLSFVPSKLAADSCNLYGPSAYCCEVPRAGKPHSLFLCRSSVFNTYLHEEVYSSVKKDIDLQISGLSGLTIP